MIDLDPKAWVEAMQMGVRTLPGTIVLGAGIVAVIRWGVCPLIDSLARLFRRGG